MVFVLLSALQLAAQPVVPVAVKFDLATHQRQAPDCRSNDPAEILVCGRRPAARAMTQEELDRLYKAKQLRAEASVGRGATVRSFVESADMGRGTISKRIMFGIKLPF